MQKVSINGIGNIKLSDKNFIAEGGQAKVYKHNKSAIKIYHDPDDMISVRKIEELNKIKAKNVLKPMELVYGSSSNKPIGYTMRYVDSTYPICRLFTKAFKKQNKISEKQIVNFVQKIQETIIKVHESDCLVVDMNEMNILSSQSFKTPIFIDVDSYQTPSYKATAIMESIRDRQVKNNNFTKDSDWFSFAVIAFQLYIGIHPYKGKHPDYKANQWQQRMEDGVSTFDSKATIPSICNDFSVIPKSHLDWMTSIFVDNERSVPPMPSGKAVSKKLVSTIISRGKETFRIEIIHEAQDEIINIYDCMGVKYYLTQSGLYKGKNLLPVKTDGFSKVIVCPSSDMNPIVAKLDKANKTLYFETVGGVSISEIRAKDVMLKHNCIYSTYEGKLTCTQFNHYGSRFIPSMKVVANVSQLSTKVFDGVICQSLLGKPWLVIPYSPTACSSVYVKELEGYKLVDMRSEGRFCIMTVSKNGIYDRLILHFDKDFKNYKLRKTEDILYEDINFTVLSNGVCVYVANDSEIELFADNSKVKKVANPPFDSTNKVFNFSGSVYFVDKNKLYKAEMKK